MALTQNLGEIIQQKMEEKKSKEQEAILSEDQQLLTDGRQFMTEHKVAFLVKSWSDPKLIEKIAPDLKMQPYVGGYQIWVGAEREWLALDEADIEYRKFQQVTEKDFLM